MVCVVSLTHSSRVCHRTCSVPRRGRMNHHFTMTGRSWRMYANEQESPEPVVEENGLKSDKDLAAEEADRLRAAEKFMVIGTGEAECKSCGYTYTPANGDPEYPIGKGTQFSQLPDDWNCPVCGAEKSMFESKQKEIAGFAENQGYGLGTNSMTGEQKSLLIFGSLAAFFALFLLGYTMN